MHPSGRTSRTIQSRGPCSSPLVHQPLFFEVHRLSVFTPRALDVDVVLDLMIHDFDIVLSWTQSQFASCMRSDFRFCPRTSTSPMFGSSSHQVVSPTSPRVASVLSGSESSILSAPSVHFRGLRSPGCPVHRRSRLAVARTNVSPGLQTRLPSHSSPSNPAHPHPGICNEKA